MTTILPEGGAEDLIDKAIFFDFMHNRTGEPKNETNKRFALEEIVENYGAESFDSFLNKINVDDERTRVVLKNICVPSIIDMLDIIHDSKRVYYIRRDVCNFVIDKYGFDESIKSEIESIDAIIRLNEISEFVDSGVFQDSCHCLHAKPLASLATLFPGSVSSDQQACSS